MSEQTTLQMIEGVLGEMPVRVSAMSGGCVGEVFRADLASGGSVVVKIDRSQRPLLEREGYMLRLLAERSSLPVPRVIACDERVLVLEMIENSGGPSDTGREDLARVVAELHGVKGERYGLEQDTLIGPLEQPNTPAADWASFFAERRILHFARDAHAQGALPTPLLRRCERVAERMATLLDDCEEPTLIHGDLWSGNVLWRDGRLAGVIDPAVYYADREVELAFMDLFGSFGRRFWEAYDQLRPIREGFWDRRRHVYKLYPLLVHVRLFGRGYVNSLQAELDAVEMEEKGKGDRRDSNPRPPGPQPGALTN